MSTGDAPREERHYSCWGTDGAIFKRCNGDVMVGLYCPTEDEDIVLIIPQKHRKGFADDMRKLAGEVEAS